MSITNINRKIYSVAFASQKVPQQMMVERQRTDGQPEENNQQPHQILTIRYLF